MFRTAGVNRRVNRPPTRTRLTRRSRKDHRIRRTDSFKGEPAGLSWTIRTGDPDRTGYSGLGWTHRTVSKRLKPPFHSRGVRVQVPSRALIRWSYVIEPGRRSDARSRFLHRSCTRCSVESWPEGRFANTIAAGGTGSTSAPIRPPGSVARRLVRACDEGWRPPEGRVRAIATRHDRRHARLVLTCHALDRSRCHRRRRIAHSR